MGFMDKVMAQAKEIQQKEAEKKSAEKERIAELDAQGIPYCPKCKSEAVQYLDRRKKLSVGRAIVGTAILPGAGTVIGALTSKKHNGVMKCLKCGNEWKI